ncbi:MAG: trypsin-like peptidase domain-containing protein [Rhodobacteraceae bacterium]|nr:trypsin-like peptidase domain-containing protein [Paracoccaceae bacterium]
MAPTVYLDPWSLASLEIELYFNETLCGHATGLIWSKDNRTFLVSNWHVFTGRHRDTGEHISPTLCEPNKVRIWFHRRGHLGQWLPHDYDLLIQGQPAWIEHPSEIYKIDLAALEITVPDQAKVYSPCDLPSEDIITTVGSDIFIIGYPFKRKTVGFPIWKRASLASEFKVSMDRTGKFFVDTATRQGMSGSVVVRKKEGLFHTERGGTYATGHPGYRFMGVYSGRLGANKEGDAQLGIVWPQSLVHELLRARQPY